MFSLQRPFFIVVIFFLSSCQDVARIADTNILIEGKKIRISYVDPDPIFECQKVKIENIITPPDLKFSGIFIGDSKEELELRARDNWIKDFYAKEAFSLDANYVAFDNLHSEGSGRFFLLDAQKAPPIVVLYRCENLIN